MTLGDKWVEEEHFPQVTVRGRNRFRASIVFTSAVFAPKLLVTLISILSDSSRSFKSPFGRGVLLKPDVSLQRLLFGMNVY
jgi:hypothetical protein